MSRLRQSDSSFAEIVEGKARRREELMSAIREADPAGLAEVAERLSKLALRCFHVFWNKWVAPYRGRLKSPSEGFPPIVD